MAAARAHRDLDAVRRGHDRAGPRGDRPRGKLRPVVQRVDLLARKFREQPVLDHRAGAGLAFLGGLEDEMDAPVETPRLGEVARGGEQHRRMAVVPAAVCAAVVHALVGQPALLVDRQRIHVGAQPDRARGLAVLEHAHDTGAADALVHRDSPGAQALGDDRRRALLLVGELRMPVDVLADRAHLGRELVHAREQRRRRGMRVHARQDRIRGPAVCAI